MTANRRLSTVLAILALLGSIAWGIVEEGGVAPPWAGWHWPMYCPELSACPYCPHHLWAPPPGSGGWEGPIRRLDTRYLWKPVPERDRAQLWEYTFHRCTDLAGDWAGHCSGASYASALRAQPPADCDTLNRDALKGLLAELYSDCIVQPMTGDSASPGELWWALRLCLGPAPSNRTPLGLAFSRRPVMMVGRKES